jgi:hypothetical protein
MMVLSAPSMANRTATARPMPLSPPVMNALAPGQLAGCEVGLVAAGGGGQLVVYGRFAWHLVLQAGGVVLVRDGHSVACRGHSFC